MKHGERKEGRGWGMTNCVRGRGQNSKEGKGL